MIVLRDPELGVAAIGHFDEFSRKKNFDGLVATFLDRVRQRKRASAWDYWEEGEGDWEWEEQVEWRLGRSRGSGGWGGAGGVPGWSPGVHHLPVQDEPPPPLPPSLGNVGHRKMLNTPTSALRRASFIASSSALKISARKKYPC